MYTYIYIISKCIYVYIYVCLLGPVTRKRIGSEFPRWGASNQVTKDLQEALFMIGNQTNRWLGE